MTPSPALLRAVVAGTSIIVLAGACSNATSKSPAKGRAGGTFTAEVPEPPKSLDVTKDFNTNTMQFESVVAEPLEQVDDAGQLHPDLATSVDSPNPETLIYHLRSGVKFSNGDPLTATDVVWSIRHTFDQKGGAQTATSVTSIKDVVATTPNTVTVTLAHPDLIARAGIALLAFVQDAKFAQAHAADIGSARAMPIGSGPYKFTADTTQSIELDRNPTWRGAKPAPDRLKVVFISNDNSAQLAMRSGSLNAAFIDNLAGASQWSRISGAKLYPAPSAIEDYLSFDVTKPPLNDLHVRKAIAYAVDRFGIAHAAFGEYGSPTDAIVPPATLVDAAPSQQDVKALFDSIPHYDFDLVKAKEELAQSSQPNGFTLKFPYPTDAQWSKLVVLNLQQNLKPLHVNIVPKPLTPNQWLTAVYANKNLGAQTLILDVTPPDPKAGLTLLLGKENAGPNGYNTAQYSTPGVESALPTADASMDKSQRWQAVQTLVRSVAEDVPYVPLFNPQSVFVLAGGWHWPATVTFNDTVNGNWVSILSH